MGNSTDNFFDIFPWSSNFETGINEIDVQHKKLLEILNRLAAHLANLAEVSTLDEIFEELVSYTDYHFKTEEKIWDNYFKDDKWYKEHQGTHEGFINDLLELKKNKDNESHEDTIHKIVTFLSKWLAYHILDTDKLMAKTVLAIQNGSSLEEAKTIAKDEMSGSARILINTVLSMYNTLSSRTMDLMRERTLRKRAQEELEKEHEELEKLLMLQSRQASMGEMISMITHQWRQPVATISMIANNMHLDIEMENMQKDVFKENIKDISTQIEYLSHTIEDFRDYFRPNKKPEEVNAESLMQNIVNIIGKALANNNIELDIDIVNNFILNTYKNELIQVLLNIINNAKDILLEKKVDNALVKVKLYTLKDKAYIDIEDNGGGIQNDIEKVFEAYFTTKSSKEGTGLGLYMVKNIVEKNLGGKVSAKNSDNGAVFNIEIPNK